MPRIFELRTFLQSQNGWKYGISLDENVKTHPLIRPFKTLTEKVRNLPLVALSGHADFPSLGIISDGHGSSGLSSSSGLSKLFRSAPGGKSPRTSFQEPSFMFCLFGSENPLDGKAMFSIWMLSQNTFIVHLQQDQEGVLLDC